VWLTQGVAFVGEGGQAYGVLRPRYGGRGPDGTAGTWKRCTPRPLVLKALGTLLLLGKYFDAFQLARRHRVDLNVLVDFWGWQRFGTTVALELVRDLADHDVRTVSELICSLRPPDCVATEGGYGLLLGSLQPTEPIEAPHAPAEALTEGTAAGPNAGKVSSVCAAVRESLLQLIGALNEAPRVLQHSSAVELAILHHPGLQRPPELGGSADASEGCKGS